MPAGDGGCRGGRARAFVDQRGVGHTRSSGITGRAGRAGDRPEEEVGGAGEEGGHLVAGGEIEGDARAPCSDRPGAAGRGVHREGGAG